MNPRNVIAVDIGGTHTDAALLTHEGELFVRKVKSTPSDPGIAFLAAVDGLLEKSGKHPGEIAAVVHGTTVATNAVIEGDFARVGLITTRGFEDILDIGTQQRVDLYDPWRAKPAAIVPRERVVGVNERVGAEGQIVQPLDDADIRRAAALLRGRVDAVAVSLIFSFMHPDHEERTAAILAEELAGVPVSIASRVAPEFREYPRTATTVLNAALLPRVGGYLSRLQERLVERGLIGAFQLMTSAGGVIPAALAAQVPAALLVSGPAGGAIAAAEIGRMLGEPKVVMLDVGGTSADVAVITDGHPQRRYRGEVVGMPVLIPQIDILPIGAGGGSLAEVDEFGSLRVGPESAGADPGPAAYGTGSRATTTDAHVVLGTLAPSGLLGGALPLDAVRAREAVIRDVAEPLGLTAERGAGSIVRIANGRMADALRAVTVARGTDIRDFALMAFGGAGPLHACALAEDLDMPRAIVPRYPGLTSALGLLMSDGRLDVAQTMIMPLRDVTPSLVAAEVDRMSSRARGAIGQEDAVVSVDVDLRYAGQAYELTIPLSAPVKEAFAARGIADLEAAFTQAHEAAYGHGWPDAPVELVTVRVRAAVPRTATQWVASGSAATPDGSGWRSGFDEVGSAVDYTVVGRDDAVADMTGPLVVTQTDATTLIPANWRIVRSDSAGMILERVGAV